MRGRRFRRGGLRRRGGGKPYGRTITSRISADSVAITDNTPTFFNILASKDDPDETIVSDGTNIAEAEAGSRILKMRLYVRTFGLDANEVQTVVLFKNRRNGFTAANVNDNLLASSTTSISREVHANVASFMKWNADNVARSGQTIRLRLPRRLRFLNDLDRLQLMVTLNGTAAKLSVFGTITWMKP